MTSFYPFAAIPDQTGAGGDDTFLPLADFLTLLSLAFIYAALVFARPTVSGEELGIAEVQEARGGPAVPVDQLHAYVAIIPVGEMTGIRVIVPGDEETYEWTLVPAKIVANEEVRRVMGLLEGKAIPEGVIIYLSPDEGRQEAHHLAIEMWRSIRVARPARLVT